MISNENEVLALCQWETAGAARPPEASLLLPDGADDLDR